MNRKLEATIVVVALLAVFVGTAFAQTNTQVLRSAFDMGFVYSSGTNTEVASVIGQSLVGRSAQSDFSILSGFLLDSTYQGGAEAVNKTKGLPTTHALLQNYPNPFNPSTSIRYDVPRGEHVTLTVYNIVGEVIATLVDQMKQPGEYTLSWNASGVPSGVYFYRIVAGDFSQTKKLVLMK